MPIIKKIAKQGNSAVLNLGRDLCAALGVEAGDEVMITVMNDYLVIRKEDAQGPRLNPQQLDIVALLKDTGRATPQEIAERLELPLASVRRHIMWLHKDGTIQRVGKGVYALPQ